MNLTAQRAAALKAAQDIIDGAKSAGRGLTPDEASNVSARVDEVKAFDAQIKAANDSRALIDAVGSLAPEQRHDAPAKNTNARAKSLGEHFVKGLGERSLKTPGTIAADEFPLFTKAATDTQAVGAAVGGAYAPLLTEVDRDFVLPYRERPVIADLLGVGTLSGNAISYPVFGALEGGTGTVAEGGQKPQLHVGDPTWRTDALSEVAGWFKLTDDMAEDLPFVVSEINSTALYDLAIKEEQQILNGNGTAPNLRGILNRSGVQTLAAANRDDNADALFRAITAVQTATGFAADGIVIHPTDYQTLRLRKDGNGQYYGGGFFAGQYGNGGLVWQPPIWGMRTVVTTAVPQGAPVVGAWGTAARLYRKGGVRVESTNSHADDFTNDKITVRVRERIALAVRYPAAFVRVTLSAAAPV